MLTHLKELVIPRAPRGARRSPFWRAVRRRHLIEHPTCLVCGGRRKLEVHHSVPFHVAPDLELDPTNLVTLCESKKHGINCHLFVGHLGDYRNRFNPNVRTHAAYLGKLIK